MTTLHIEDYALLGDLRTGALVGRDGSIDWLSLPRFDSPAAFANLLGQESNGHWRVAPTERRTCTRRHYRDSSLVLETHWTTADGAVRVIDFMPPTSTHTHVVRIVEGLVGHVAMTMTLAPRLGYGRSIPVLHATPGGGVAVHGEDQMHLQSTAPLTGTGGTWTSNFTVTAGQRHTFTLTHQSAPGSDLPGCDRTTEDPQAALSATDNYWRQWAAKSTYTGPWANDVTRSLILLKALTYAPTGGILAAATTSLPEDIGGARNWDYRYAWLRDAAFTVHAFLATGYVEEAVAWRNWLVATTAGDPGRLQIMYGVDGGRDLPEVTLDWLAGHAASRPVRIGNGAATQQQNDVWGEVLDALTATAALTGESPSDQWLQRRLLKQIEASWADPDHGLWEMRGPRRHFVHSKVLAWVGVDRAVKAAEVAGATTPQELTRLRDLRAAIRADVTTRGFKQSRGAFTQSYGSNRLDAAVLLLPRYGFLPWTDPRMVATVEAVEAELGASGFVRRYAVNGVGTNVDGVPGDEGVFLAASFWLVEALHGVGRTDEAMVLFERLLAVGNDVGMLSEEYDPATGHHLGNTPQAFSHAGLVTTAVALSNVVAASIMRPLTTRGQRPTADAVAAEGEPA